MKNNKVDRNTACVHERLTKIFLSSLSLFSLSPFLSPFSSISLIYLCLFLSMSLPSPPPPPLSLSLSLSLQLPLPVFFSLRLSLISLCSLLYLRLFLSMSPLSPPSSPLPSPPSSPVCRLQPGVPVPRDLHSSRELHPLPGHPTSARTAGGQQPPVHPKTDPGSYTGRNGVLGAQLLYLPGFVRRLLLLTGGSLQSPCTIRLVKNMFYNH